MMPSKPSNKYAVFAALFALVVIGLLIIQSSAGKPGTGPVNQAPIGWEIFSDTTRKISFNYPRELGTKYLHPMDWPPMVQILNTPISCTEAGTETSRAGETSLDSINGRQYCVTKVTEGAAGSIYTQYAYAFAKSGKVAILTFSLHFVQCQNYEDPQKTECITERNVFNIDQIIDQIAQTLKF